MSAPTKRSWRWLEWRYPSTPQADREHDVWGRQEARSRCGREHWTVAAAPALELCERGFDVQVLEATVRPGGRILTIRAPLTQDRYVEAGAAHVINDPALLTLCAQLGLMVSQFAPSRGLRRVSLVGGERRTWPPNAPRPRRWALGPEDEKLGDAGRMQKYFAEAYDFEPAAPLPSRLFQLDALSGAEFLRQRGASPGFVAEIDDWLGIGDAGIESMSALSLVQQWAEIQREIRLGGNGRIMGGCDQLPNAIAARLGARIRYGAEVTRIEQDSQAVRVTFRDGASQRSLPSDHVIFAIPPPLLKKIAQSPSLTADKQRALADLELENVTRFWAQTRDRFWNLRGESGRVDSDSPLGPVRDETEGMEGTDGILGLYVRRTEARRLAALSDADRTRAALSYLELAQPGLRDRVVTTVSKSWSLDPFQQGAYAYFKVGQLTALGPALARAEGRLHFAGDHTSHRPGFMHGALAAAARVVAEICDPAKRASR